MLTPKNDENDAKAVRRYIEGTNVGVRVGRVESEAANVIAKINADLLVLPTMRR